MKTCAPASSSRRSTTNFLDSQLTAAAAVLAAQEKKMREYEAAHMGELPDQLQSNLQILSGAQGQLQSAIDARDKALQQQAYLTSLAAQYDQMGVTEIHRRDARSYRPANRVDAGRTGYLGIQVHPRPSRRQEAEGHHRQDGANE